MINNIVSHFRQFVLSSTNFVGIIRKNKLQSVKNNSIRATYFVTSTDEQKTVPKSIPETKLSILTKTEASRQLLPGAPIGYKISENISKKTYQNYNR